MGRGPGTTAGEPRTASRPVCDARGVEGQTAGMQDDGVREEVAVIPDLDKRRAEGALDRRQRRQQDQASSEPPEHPLAVPVEIALDECCRGTEGIPQISWRPPLGRGVAHHRCPTEVEEQAQDQEDDRDPDGPDPALQALEDPVFDARVIEGPVRHRWESCHAPYSESTAVVRGGWLVSVGARGHGRSRPRNGYRRMTALDELLNCVAPESGSGQEFNVGYSRLQQRP